VELIRSVLLPFVENQPEKPIRFRLDAAPDLPVIRADRALLSRALRNLVQNAAYAMAGGGTLTVRARLLGRGGDAPHLAISVRDTGPGIAPDLEKRIFTPFFTTRPEGTGLGLPIVQKAVAAHGGSLEVESVVGRGATFTILLPAGEEAVESNGGGRAARGDSRVRRSGDPVRPAR